MDITNTRSRKSRVDNRYRHWAQDVAPRKETVGKRTAVRGEKEGDPLLEHGEEPLLIREQRGRPVMGRAHRAFHRQAAPAPSPNVLTVGVQVVATLDATGGIIAQETITPALTPALPSVVNQALPSLPVVPSVPPFPSFPSAAVPSVPSVPPFPSDLTVPAYPAPPAVSSVPTVAPISSALVSSAPASSTVPTPTAIANSIAQTSFPSSSFNGTTTSTPTSTLTSSLSSSFLSSHNSTSTTSVSSLSSSSASLSSNSTTSQSSNQSTQSSATQTSASSSIDLTVPTPTASTVLSGGGGGGANPAATSPPPASTSAALAGATSNSIPPLDTPKTVGTVIGSLAGAALIFAVILFLIKRHKQRQNGGALQLVGSDTADVRSVPPSSQQQMTTRSSFTPAGAAAFLNRFSAVSRSTAETSTTGERSFQRISGRKLPSAFSEGMTSEQFARGEGTLSGSSFYRDDNGFYGGPGPAANKEYGPGPAAHKEFGPGPAAHKEFGTVPAAQKEYGKETSATANAMGTQERMMPSPARTPVVYHPEDDPPWGTNRNGGSTLSPPHSPNPEYVRSTLGRSLPSHDGSRSSRFTENV